MLVFESRIIPGLAHPAQVNDDNLVILLRGETITPALAEAMHTVMHWLIRHRPPVSRKEAEHLLGLRRNGLDAKVAAGELMPIRIGSQWLFTVAQLIDYANTCERGPDLSMPRMDLFRVDLADGELDFPVVPRGDGLGIYMQVGRPVDERFQTYLAAAQRGIYAKRAPVKVPEAAVRLGVSETSLRRSMRRDEVFYHEIGRLTLFFPEDIARTIAWNQGNEVSGLISGTR